MSGLEMSQNRLGLSWSRAEVTERLHVIMNNIYTASKAAADEYGTDLAGGANIAGGALLPCCAVLCMPSHAVIC